MRLRVLAAIIATSAGVAGDARAQTTTRVSVDAAGAQLTGGASLGAISPDGSHVAFAVRGDGVFVRPRGSASGLSSLGALAPNTAPNLLALSDDGSYVAWSVSQGAFRGDRLGGAPTRFDLYSDGTNPAFAGPSVAISAGGGLAAFSGGASLSGPPDPNAGAWLRDIDAGTSERVGILPDGSAPSNALPIALGAGGRFVLFNAGGGAYLRDRSAGTTERVDLGVDGQPLNASATDMTPDARHVVLGAGGGVLLRDRQAGTVERIDLSTAGTPPSSGFSFGGRVSDDARYVVFDTFSSHFDAADTNGFSSDSYVRDRVARTTTRATVTDAGGLPAQGGSGSSISNDGRYVAFVSNSPDIVSGDDNGAADVFVRDRGLPSSGDTLPVGPGGTVAVEEVAITSPVAGEVTITEVTSGVTPPAGYEIAGAVYDIQAPTASPPDPLRLAFTAPVADQPALDAIVVLRGDTAIPNCDGPLDPADPDAVCVAGRTLGDGVGTIEVVSWHASLWALAVPSGGPALNWGGFRAPVDDPPTPNRAKAGSSVPVRFSLGGDHGLDVLAEAPQSFASACDSWTADGDALEQTADSARAGTLSYDSGSQTYLYVWKTDRRWTGTCRTLILRFTDGSEQQARFAF